MKYVVLLLLFGYALANENKKLGLHKESPAGSCNEIYQRNPTSRGTIGQYWIKTNEGLFNVTCNMKLKCDGVEGGWMQVVNVDMNRDDSCPGDWHKITSPRRLCVGYEIGCTPAHYCMNGYSYQHICGQAKGYQKGTPDAFNSGIQSIDHAYVDGVSITLTSPRTHVWTYAAGYCNECGSYTYYNCPCANPPGRRPPRFVGNDYYCESGSTRSPHVHSYYTSDPLWDGSGCGGSIGCCADIDKPWFHKRLPSTEAKDIEVNICCNEVPDKEDISIEKLEIYVI